MQISARLRVASALLLLGLAACAPTTDADRAIIGAGVGAVAADLSGKSVIGGAALGAGAGALCDDAGVCQGRAGYRRDAYGRLY